MCRSGVVDNPLETLIGAIERFVQVPTLELTPTELGVHLVRLRHGIDLLELGFASGAATFAATDEYNAQGSVTPIDWIRHHCRMSGHAAARAVAAGEQMGRLPASVAALDAGDIGFAHFSLLAGTARALGATPGAAVPARIWRTWPRGYMAGRSLRAEKSPQEHISQSQRPSWQPSS